MARVETLIMAALMVIGASANAQERQPAVKDATVFGYKLHYLEAGRGEPVILLHGTGGEGARWMPQIKGLSADFRVIALDQIGFGQSDKQLTTYHSGVFAEFLGGFLKAIGVPKATLIGQSMGANALVAHAKRRLGVDFHETTRDGVFSLEQVFCLGNCALSPAAMIDGQLYGRVTPERFDQLVAETGK